MVSKHDQPGNPHPPDVLAQTGSWDTHDYHALPAVTPAATGGWVIVFFIVCGHICEVHALRPRMGKGGALKVDIELESEPPLEEETDSVCQSTISTMSMKT
jgi:hypothetical protein